MNVCPTVEIDSRRHPLFNIPIKDINQAVELTQVSHSSFISAS